MKLCGLGKIPSNSLVISFGDAVVVAATHDVVTFVGATAAVYVYVQ